jgi:hypothetical protein
MKSDEWRMKNEERRMKSEERGMFLNADWGMEFRGIRVQ